MKPYLCLVAYLLIATSFKIVKHQSTANSLNAITAEQNDKPVQYILVPYRIKNLWGFSDTKGNMKITPQYDDVKQIKYYWRDGKSFQSAMVVRKGNNLFAINHYNEIIVPPGDNFDDINLDYYYYGIAIVSKHGKKGIFLNRKQIIPCQYDGVEREKNLSFRVLADGKSGILNSKGKIVVPVEYYGMHIKAADKEHVTWIAGKTGSADREFQDDMVVDPATQEMHSFTTNGLWPATLDLEQKEKDTIMKNIRKAYPNAAMDRQYAYIIYIKNSSKLGIFNMLKNKQTVPYEYDELMVEKNTQPKIAIRVKKGGLYGYIDEDNNVLAPFIFNAITKAYNYFALHQGQKTGLLTDDLRYIPARYISIKPLDNVYDAAASQELSFYEVITTSGQKGYINSSGFEYFKD